MRLLKIAITLLLLGGITIPVVSCASQPSSTSENQTATVQRGDLSTNITASGNLKLSRTATIAFDIDGTVAEVLVKEGDIVEEGQLVATLDVSKWEDNLAALESQVRARERSLVQADINLKNAEIALEKAQDTYRWPDIEVAEADMDTAKAHLQYALDGRAASTGDLSAIWENAISRARVELEAAEKKLAALLTGADPNEVTIKKKQLELAQGQLDDAQRAVTDAREALEKAMLTSPEVRAPFDGFITTVNVEGGDEVKKGTVAAQVADPGRFEVDILVSEMDIMNVKVGANATVQADALSGGGFPAIVTQIAPTATIQSGVVNYKVKVELQSLEGIIQQRQAAQQEVVQNAQSGEIPERIQQAIDEGRMTREQAEEFMNRMQQSQGSRQSQVPTTVSGDLQLREGLTVTVSVMLDQRTDVLLVPNSAIIGSGRQTSVQVVTAAGATEQRTIQVGISNWQYTEVTAGLNEGEQVIMPKATGNTSTPSQQGQGGFAPGMRIIR